MNIKQVIKSQKIRHFIMKCGFWMPDNLMLSIQYRLSLGIWPNLQNPKRFTEFIQWYKANYRDPLMLLCVDKYKVRDYICKTIGNEYLTPLYGCYEKATDINFEKLPNSFVIKTTDGGSGDNVLICHNKSEINIDKTIRQIDSWKNKMYYIISREWAYRGARNCKIIVEKMLGDGKLSDYKFFCFNGKVKFFKIDFDRYTKHRANYYWSDLTFIDVVESNFTPNPNLELPPKDALSKMIHIAEKLAKPFPFVRVDLYYVDNKIFFGEMTFYPGSGYIGFTPDNYDYIFGKFVSSK